MAVTLKPSGTTAVWGIKTETGDTFASAKILSQKVSKSIEQEPLLNSDGETVALALYDAKTETEIEVIVESAITAPDIGDAIQIAGESGMVTGVDLQWEQKGWKKLSIKATRFHAMGD